MGRPTSLTKGNIMERRGMFYQGAKKRGKKGEKQPFSSRSEERGGSRNGRVLFPIKQKVFHPSTRRKKGKKKRGRSHLNFHGGEKGRGERPGEFVSVSRVFRGKGKGPSPSIYIRGRGKEARKGGKTFP